jgi:hypothetical protein
MVHHIDDVMYDFSEKYLAIIDLFKQLKNTIQHHVEE